MSTKRSPSSASRRYPVCLQITCLVTAFAVMFGVGCLQSNSQEKTPKSRTKSPAPAAKTGGKRATVPAPSLKGGLAWLNTEKPLTLKKLRGRVVLLDFWTLCCINCIHTLPDLAKLEAKYGAALIVIGVHTPKFPNERETSSIRKAVLRYEVKHPVVNDGDMLIWRRYHVNSWPTLVLIDPEGNYYGRIAGEGGYELLDQHIGKLVKQYRAKKMLNEKPLNLKLVQEERESPLYFPGKVLADEVSNRLFIADSTNHRVVVTDLKGKNIAVAGDGREGNKDGSFEKARFSDPQGMALDGDTLYVADRQNHQIRALDLKKKTVTTIAGIGRQNRFNRLRGGPARKTGLNSPWDLLLHENKLFIAMAGHHQIWTHDLKKNWVDPYAGDGREDIRDRPLMQAWLAQPSGLASDGKNLYVADSEISAIRKMPLNGRGQVKTIVGRGLFVFGDKDGTGDDVRLQHCLGVAYRNGKLYIADTYNNKIKLIDPKTRTCKTLLGGPDGWVRGKLFNEPGGLSFAGNKLYVADTNAHRIRVVDMTTGAVSTLELQGVPRVSLPKEAKKAK